jgi:TRAP-type uncharacterized transport system substrate-binding protein
MEPLPQGANFRRAKFMWEVGLHIAGNPAIKYGGNRDMCIAVGSGGGDKFVPSLRLASGSAIMAHDVIKGGIEMAFVNPSAMLTQAYRGVGLFDKPLPVRIVANYPSWDRFVIAFRKELGFRSLHDVKKARYPLQMSLREDPTHSTLVLINQLLPFYGMSIAEIESWGGRIHPCGGPGDKRRLNPIKEGKMDAVFDEGIVTWLDTALANGMVPIELEPDAFAHVGKLGWRRVTIPTSEYPKHLDRDHPCIDFSGWPIYSSASLPDQVAYDVCAALAAREAELPVEEGTYTGVTQMVTETDATPMDVPLHPGSVRWLREQGR